MFCELTIRQNNLYTIHTYVYYKLLIALLWTQCFTKTILKLVSQMGFELALENVLKFWSTGLILMDSEFHRRWQAVQNALSPVWDLVLGTKVKSGILWFKFLLWFQIDGALYLDLVLLQQLQTCFQWTTGITISSITSLHVFSLSSLLVYTTTYCEDRLLLFLFCILSIFTTVVWWLTFLQITKWKQNQTLNRITDTSSSAVSRIKFTQH